MSHGVAAAALNLNHYRVQSREHFWRKQKRGVYKQNSASEYSIVRRIHGLFAQALKRFRVRLRPSARAVCSPGLGLTVHSLFFLCRFVPIVERPAAVAAVL